MSQLSFSATSPAAVAVDAEEIFQLVKRTEIDPHEVEEAGASVIEVSVLWKSAILHVTHLEERQNFVLAAREPSKAPAARTLLGGLAAGSSVIATGAATGNYAIGACGALLALAGAGAGIMLDQRNVRERTLSARFVVDAELLGGTDEVPVVVHEDGRSHFVFLPGATGSVEQDGRRTPLESLMTNGDAQRTDVAGGSHRIDVRSGARYRMELGGLSVLARVVPAPRRIAGARRRDPATVWTAIGSAAAVVTVIGAALLASADHDALMAQDDGDQMSELRRIMQLERDRQPEERPQDNNNGAAPAAASSRHNGAEGAAGRPDRPTARGRISVANHHQADHLSNVPAREQVQNRGVFIGLQGSPMLSAEGPVDPWSAFQDSSGPDNESHRGTFSDDPPGDGFGYDGLGQLGPGHGGGGVDQTVGLARITGLRDGHGGDPYGTTVGTHLGNAATHGPTLRPARPSVEGGTLPAEAIRRVVLRNIGQVAHCQEQGMALNPQLQGRVVVRFVIGGDGSVLGANVTESSLAVPSVGACIASTVRRWNFPSPDGGGIVTVNYPFVLTLAQ